MTDTVSLLIQELKALHKSEKAAQMSIFFKTGKGQYAEGDVFWGLTAPEMKAIVKKYYKEIALAEIEKLLASSIHEQRSAGLQCLVSKFAKADTAARNEIVDFYVAHTAAVNNWDLVDTTAPYLLGAWSCDNNDTGRIWKLAKSQNLWEERIAVVSTWYLIRNNVFEPTQALAEYFLNHQHDLMHKACGWMLRETGKRNEKTLIGFLDKYYRQMPRTMLRYSLERLSPEQKKHYMQK